MTILNITDDNCEQEISIVKHNNILVKNERSFFKFYIYFYRCLIEKDRNIRISIGNQIISSKSYMLYSFTDYKELLENLSFKKNTLLYEYILNIIQNRIFK